MRQLFATVCVLLAFAAPVVAQVQTVVNTELPDAAAPSDATSNPTAPGVTAFAMAWGGSTWARLTYGSAGSAASMVFTVQGIASMTPLRVDVAQVLGSTHSATNPLFVRAVSSTGVVADDVVDGAAISGGPASVPVGCHGEASQTAVDEDDKSNISCDLNGSIYVVGGLVDEGTFTYATSRALAMGAVAESTSDTLSDGQIGVPTMTLDRKLYTALQDPCSRISKTYYVVDTADGTNLEIANAVSSEFFYICSINLVAAGATTVLISEDDTDGCGSPTAGLNGGSTGTTAEGQAFAANGGMTLGNGTGTVMKTGTAARYLCLDQSASVQLSGTIAYVSAP